MLQNSWQLQGMSYSQAECMGKPSIGACYTDKHSDAHELVLGATCAICGAKATNAHHVPQKGFGGGRRRLVLWGRVLRPALISLCGSGTTGCHGKCHHGLYTIRWEWNKDEYAEAWWDGKMLDLIESDLLYEYGKWVIDDRKQGRTYDLLRRQYEI